MTDGVGVSRRSLLKGGAAIGGGTAVGALLLRSQPDPATAQTSGFTANNQTVSNGNGALNTLTIDPTFTVEWSNAGGTVTDIEFIFGPDIGTDGYTYSEVVSVDGENQGANGSQTFDSFNSGNPISLLNPPGDTTGFNASAFEPSAEGESETTTVNLTIGGILADYTTATAAPGGSVDSKRTLISRTGSNPLVNTSFDVTVENVEGSATVTGGSANTNAN